MNSASTQSSKSTQQHSKYNHTLPPNDLLGDLPGYEDEVAAEFPSPPVPTASTVVSSHTTTANLTRNQFINTSAAVRTANIHKTRRNSNNNSQQPTNNSESSTPNNYKLLKKGKKILEKLSSFEFRS